MTESRTTMTESLVERAKQLGDELKKTGTSVFHAGLGVVAATEEHARDTFHSLAEKGKEVGADEHRLIARATREAKEIGQEIERRVESTVTATLNRAGVPSRDEINQLSSRVEALTRKVDELAAKNALTERDHG